MGSTRESVLNKPWFRCTAIGLIAVFAMGVAAWLRLPHIAGRVASFVLGVQVEMEDLTVRPLAKKIAIRNLTVGQPTGFGEEPMILVETILVTGWDGVLSDQPRVNDVRIDKAQVFLFTNKEKLNNLQVFLDGLSDENEEKRTPDEPPETSMMVDRLEITNISMRWRDESVGKTGHELNVADAQLVVERLAVGALENVEPGLMTFDGRLRQPGTEDALMTSVARFGPLATGDPYLRLAFRGTGILYRTFVPLIPPNTDLILGGDGIDASLDAKVADGRLDVVTRALTSRNGNYNAAVTGTLENPQIQLPQKLGAVASRMTGGAGRFMGSVLHGGGALVSGTLGTVGAAGKGVLGAAGSLLKGAGQSAKGVVTGDSETAKEGLHTMTAGTGNELVGAVTNSAEEIGATGKRTADNLANDPKLQKWVREIPVRHEAATADLLEALLAEPFPPRIEPASGDDKE